MKFNQEQMIEYLNMEAKYRELQDRAERLFKTDEVRNDEALYADLCRRYAIATIEIIKLRSWVRGASV